MRCSDCGTDNREGRKFCAQCGVRLAVACPACGAGNEPGENFCGECGAPLAASKQAQASAPAPAAAEPAGARKVVTILFADLVGSTALHERLDPESARRFMESYYAAAHQAVESHGGSALRARDPMAQRTEVIAACSLLNWMTSLGAPISEKQAA